MSTTTKTDSQIRLVAILVAVGAVILLAVGVFVRVSAAEESWHGTELDNPLPRPAFTLTDTDGRPFDFAAETEGRLTLLFFGFTNCPDICPGHMGILQGVKDTPGVPDPLVVFVTTDPERDTPERLREWLDGFDEDFIGLTGTPEEVGAAEAAAKVAGSIRTTDDDGDVEVGHDARIVAYTPDDQAHVIYEFGTRSQDWISDLPRLLEEFPA